MAETQYTHVYSSDDKLKWFGHGEWVEECDYATFEYSGIKCKIIRMVREEFPNRNRMFGGYFCGYCQIPKGHIDYNCEDCSSLGYEVHYGITYGKLEENKEFWIGFDCAHSGDSIPSMTKMKNVRKNETKKMLIDLGRKEDFTSILFCDTYKNIKFVEKECRSLAEQISKRCK